MTNKRLTQAINSVKDEVLLQAAPAELSRADEQVRQVREGLLAPPPPRPIARRPLREVLRSWRSLHDPSEFYAHEFRDFFEDEGARPRGSGLSLEICPWCGQRRCLVNWSKARFCCTACGESGGLRRASLVGEQRSLEYRRQMAESRARLLAAGGIIPRRGEEDGKRDLETKKGIGMLMVAESADAWRSEASPLDVRLSALLEDFEGCGHDVFWREYEHRNPDHRHSRQPALKACGGRGHEECCWEHSVRDWRRWEQQASVAYAEDKVEVLELLAPGHGPSDVGIAFRKLMHRRPLQRLFERTAGYITLTQAGASVRILVRAHDLELLGRASGMWGQYFAEGTVRRVPVADGSDALELLAELRCQAEQAPFLLTSRGLVAPEVARRWLAEESGDEEAGRHRVVFGPRFRVRTETASEQAVSISSVDSKEGTDENKTASYSVEQPWEPCRVCRDLACGQRPVHGARLWTKREIERQVARGELTPIEREGGVIYLVVDDPPASSRKTTPADRRTESPGRSGGSQDKQQAFHRRSSRQPSVRRRATAGRWEPSQP